jgi:hypothetical protein
MLNALVTGKKHCPGLMPDVCLRNSKARTLPTARPVVLLVLLTWILTGCARPTKPDAPDLSQLELTFGKLPSARLLASSRVALAQDGNVDEADSADALAENRAQMWIVLTGEPLPLPVKRTRPVARNRKFSVPEDAAPIDLRRAAVQPNAFEAKAMGTILAGSGVDESEVPPRPAPTGHSYSWPQGDAIWHVRELETSGGWVSVVEKSN